MNWFLSLFKPAPRPPIGPFVQGIIASVKTDLETWRRDDARFRHMPTGMTMEAIDVGDFDEICMTCRMVPHQETNWAEDKALVQACYDLGAAIEAREVEAAAQHAGAVRAAFEARFPS